MNALIILAHGSRRRESNKEIAEMADSVAAIADGAYDNISYAYLEVVEPTLLQAIDKVIHDDMSRVTVMPYFLNSGNHVTRDIPAMIKQAEAKYPTCSFVLSPCIGMHESMPKLILEQAKK